MNVNEKITVLPKEMMGLVRWSLRARRVPASYARAAGEMVLYAELFHGCGLTYLLTFLQGEIEYQRPFLQEDAGENGRLSVGRVDPLLFAPAAFDFVWARASQRGRYCLQVDITAVEGTLLEPLLLKLARRGGGAGWGINGRWQYAQAYSGDAILQTEPAAGWPRDLPTEGLVIVSAAGSGAAQVDGAQVAARRQRWLQAERRGVGVKTAVYHPLKAIANEILL